MKIECDELLVICDNCGHAIHVKELDNNLIKPNNKNDKLISEQDAIDALIEWYGCEPDDIDYFKEILAKKSSAQPELHWISCSERLPEEAGWYLCTYKDRRVNTKYWSKNKGWTDNIRLHMFELYDIRSRLTKEEVKLADESIYWDDWVVAWSRLPEPYKENKE